VKVAHAFVGRGVVRRCLDHPEGDRVDADAVSCVLGGERARDSVETAFREGGQGRGRRASGVIYEAGCDVDDVAAALDDHLAYRSLGDLKEPGQVHGGDRGEVLGRVVREGLADEDARVVDQGVDPSEPPERLVDDALGGLCVGDVTLHGQDVGFLGGVDRARGRDDPVTSTSKRCCEARADALRRASDDRDFLRLAHMVHARR